jgi:hypothetical protein
MATALAHPLIWIKLAAEGRLQIVVKRFWHTE